MDNRTQENLELEKLRQKISSTFLPWDLKEKALNMIERLNLSLKYGGFFSFFDQVSHYVDWITALPWEKTTPDNLDILNAREILEKHHYGLGEIKDRILEYLSVMKLNLERAKKNSFPSHNFARAPILFFVGLVGTGKTTIASSIAEAMNRKFIRIPFGGLSSALDLKGQSRLHPEAEPGLIIKALRRVGTKNPVILLDEIDRVAEGKKGDIAGVLIELLDPEQNFAFTDFYLDYPFDLSQVLFIATANNTHNLSPAVLDRLEILQMPSYTDEEKMIIGRSYLFPKALAENGLSPEQLQIEDNLWPMIVRPLGFDSGIRSLERSINEICRKVARLIVEGKGNSFKIDQHNFKQFLSTW